MSGESEKAELREQLKALAEKNRSEKCRMDELLGAVIHSQEGELERHKAEFVDLQACYVVCDFATSEIFVSLLLFRAKDVYFGRFMPLLDPWTSRTQRTKRNRQRTGCAALRGVTQTPVRRMDWAIA